MNVDIIARITTQGQWPDGDRAPSGSAQVTIKNDRNVLGPVFS